MSSIWTEQYALYAGAAMSLPGVIFMLTCRKLWNETAESSRFNIDMNHKDFKVWAALASHLSFIIGTILFVLGTICGGIALGFPPALAMLGGLSGAITQLFFMVIFNTSPMGMPEVSGPPVPARILLIGVEAMLAFNAYTGFNAGYYTDLPKFLGFLAYAVLIPSIIAKKHRNAGWEAQPKLKSA